MVHHIASLSINMGNITTDDALLSELNDQKAVLLIPAIAYVAVLMIVGFIGNVLVCIFYGCKTKPNPNSVFIIILATFDLISCVITMPIEIMDLRFFYMFTNGAACKSARFLNSFATMGSASTLIAIAIDRHRRMCRPFKKQWDIKDAKIACLVAAGFSLVLSWPAAIFNGSVSVNVTDPDNSSVILEGFDCTTTKDEEYQTYLLAFNAVQFLVFIVAVCILVVLYCKIGHVLYKHKKRRMKYASTHNTHSTHNNSMVDSTETDVSLNNSTEKDSDSAKTKHKIEFSSKHDVILRPKSPMSESHDSRPTSRESHAISKEHSPDIKTVKYTIIMLAITVVFVLSFLPYLILVLWRLFQTGYEVDILSDAGLVAFQIGIRSYLLNSAANPLLYGFFNPKFRTFFYSWFCPCCSKRLGDIQLSTSSGGH